MPREGHKSRNCKKLCDNDNNEQKHVFRTQIRRCFSFHRRHVLLKIMIIDENCNASIYMYITEQFELVWTCFLWINRMQNCYGSIKNSSLRTVLQLKCAVTEESGRAHIYMLVTFQQQMFQYFIAHFPCDLHVHVWDTEEHNLWSLTVFLQIAVYKNLDCYMYMQVHVQYNRCQQAQCLHSRFALTVCHVTALWCNKVFVEKERKEMMNFAFPCRAVMNSGNTTASTDNLSTFGNAQEYLVSLHIHVYKQNESVCWRYTHVCM